MHCMPAEIFQITLSDVPGDRLDMIASGPAAPDPSSFRDAAAILKKYGIPLSKDLESAIRTETPKSVQNASFHIAGNVAGLCAAAQKAAQKKGYISEVVTDRLAGEARTVGEKIVSYAADQINGSLTEKTKRCLIWGGETTVTVRGHGKGGRSQELALSAARKISGMKNIVILSAGSDGTDGPTDAAGAIVDTMTWEKISMAGAEPGKLLDENDSYTALSLSESLFRTGPTGTNVNDLILFLAENY